MSQWRWTFYDPHQGTQTLGLYHGEDSGHVMIYLNQKVVIIDFMVHKTKTYSLMVNELLVKLNLVENNGEFTYDFESESTSIEPPGMMSWFKNCLLYTSPSP